MEINEDVKKFCMDRIEQKIEKLQKAFRDMAFGC